MEYLERWVSNLFFQNKFGRLESRLKKFTNPSQVISLDNLDEFKANKIENYFDKNYSVKKEKDLIKEGKYSVSIRIKPIGKQDKRTNINFEEKFLNNLKNSWKLLSLVGLMEYTTNGQQKDYKNGKSSLFVNSKSASHFVLSFATIFYFSFVTQTGEWNPKNQYIKLIQQKVYEEQIQQEKIKND